MNNGKKSNNSDEQNYSNGPSAFNPNSADLTPFSAGTGVDMGNDDMNLGMGSNVLSGSVGIPLGLGMALGMHSEANSYWNSLERTNKTKIIKYIQSATTGKDAKERVNRSILGLSQKDINFLNE